MFKVAFVFAAFMAVSSAVVRECDSGVAGPFPVEHRITGCEDLTTRCRLVRAQNTIGEIDFIASECQKSIFVSANKA